MRGPVYWVKEIFIALLLVTLIICLLFAAGSCVIVWLVM